MLKNSPDAMATYIIKIIPRIRWNDDQDQGLTGCRRTHMPGPLRHLRLAVFPRVETFPATFCPTWRRKDSHLGLYVVLHTAGSLS